MEIHLNWWSAQQDKSEQILLRGVNNMGHKCLTERYLLECLDARKAHADELTEPLPQELELLEKLRGSVKKFEKPLDGCRDEFLDSAAPCTGEYLEYRDQQELGRQRR